jgi:hypothetical protein
MPLSYPVVVEVFGPIKRILQLSVSDKSNLGHSKAIPAMSPP